MRPSAHKFPIETGRYAVFSVEMTLEMKIITVWYAPITSSYKRGTNSCKRCTMDISSNFKQFDKKSLFLYLLCVADKPISNIVS